MPSKETHPREWAIFSSIDVDDDGKVDKAELLSACENMGLGEERASLADTLDANHDGLVDFEEFVAGFGAVSAMTANAPVKAGWGSEGCFGLGVAGNVAGHMAQAGMEQQASATPANIFAFFVPETVANSAPTETHNDEKTLERLHSFPVTTNVVEYPRVEGASKVRTHAHARRHNAQRTHGTPQHNFPPLFGNV
jgi:hypothetical protein